MQDLFVERMSPLQFWLLLVLILFTSAAESPENDGVGMVTSFMTQLAALLERNDLRLLLEVENQPTNHKHSTAADGKVKGCVLGGLLICFR